jgi:hypothetical protein
MIWPTPYPLSTTLHIGGNDASRVILPIVPRRAPAQPSFAKPEPAPPLPGHSSKGDTWPGDFHVDRDEQQGVTRVTWGGTTRTTFPWGVEESREKMFYQLADAKPAENIVRGDASFDVHVRDTVLTWRVHLLLGSDATHFFYTFERQLLQDGNLLRSRTWQAKIVRDLQ